MKHVSLSESEIQENVRTYLTAVGVDSKAEFPADLLPLLFKCDFQTGRLEWKRRSEAFFPHRPDAAKTFNAQFAGKEAFTASSHGYRVGRLYDRRFQAHRVVFALANGRWPHGEIDHINGDRADNRLSNLRECSHADNLRNCRLGRNNTSGFNGVCENTWGSWFAQIKFNGRNHFLGTYATKELASAARRKAERCFGFHENHGRIA